MSITDITILSPHQDDAALSLANFIVHYSKIYEFSIINCFTISNYSPYWQYSFVDEIIQKRNEEDLCFIKLAQTNDINCINLAELDSLIRLKTKDLDYITMERPLNAQDFYHLFSLQLKLSHYIKNQLILLPLGVGNHIDHLLACLAGISLSNNKCPFAFYLDVPYWLSMSTKDIQKRIHFVESFIDNDLSPHILVTPNLWDKKVLSEVYSSQITRHDIELISKAPFQGEIILLPKKSNISKELKLIEVAWTDLNH